VFRFNVLGLVMTVISFAIGALVRLISGQDDTAMAVTAGLLLFIADTIYRFRIQTSGTFWGRWLSPQNGGWLAFPVWIMGILFVIYGFVEV